MEDGLEELQQRLVEMLLAFQEFTQENGVTFFLVGGSFFGRVMKNCFGVC